MVITMRLTDIELEVMNILWKSGTPMTASDLIAASPADRTWKETSIHVILKTLEAKKAAAVDHYVPTAGRAAKAYKAALTKAQYVASRVLEFDVAIPDLLLAIAEDEKYAEKFSEE